MPQVYVITNTVNGKQYVGQTRLSLHRRWLAHCNAARGDRQVCRVFHAAIRKYGAEAFTVETYVPLHPDVTQIEIDTAERQAIAECGSLVPIGYNLWSARGGRGSIHPETKAKMSTAHMGRKHSPEHAAKIAATQRGRKHSVEEIEQMRIGRWVNRSYSHSLETRAKIGAANAGRPQHPNLVAALRRAHCGATRSPEQCANISEGKRKAAALRREQSLV